MLVVDTLALAALENDLNIRELLNAECVTVYPGSALHCNSLLTLSPTPYFQCNRNLRFEELNDAMHVLVCAHTQRCVDCCVCFFFHPSLLSLTSTRSCLQ